MILVDTSVWVDHLRGGDPALVALLQAGAVLAHPFVTGEIALGSLKQRRMVLDALGDLPQVRVANDDEVLHFIEQTGLAGTGIGYVDAHLLASARLEAGTTVLLATNASTRPHAVWHWRHNKEGTMRIRPVFAGLLAALAIAAPAAAEFPDKPIRIMAPYAPGGNIDVTSRIIADKLKDVLGVTVLVENKAGASGMIGSDVIARSAPDGYNLLVSANSLVVVPAIYGNAPYDWRTAFQPISHIQAVPGVILVNPSSPIRTLAEFIKLGIDKPNTLIIADSGIGTTNHIIEVLLSAASGAQYTLVHYKGSGQATIDVISGQVPAQIDQVNSALPHIKGGKLRALAVTADKRIPELPDVPTVKELGIKGLEDFTYSTYTGLFGPAKMPPAVLKKLNDAMVKILTDPATIKRFADLTAEAKPSTPEQLAAMLDKEDKLVVPLIKKLGIKAE